jgi:hypothetical protein
MAMDALPTRSRQCRGALLSSDRPTLASCPNEESADHVTPRRLLYSVEPP